MAVESKGEIYVCEKCKNEVIVSKVGGGVLSCCNTEMKKIEECNVEEYEAEDYEE